MKIRKNYSYHYTRNKPTNYEELFDFLKPNISQRNPKIGSLAIDADVCDEEKEFNKLVDRLNLESSAGDSGDNMSNTDLSNSIDECTSNKPQKSPKSKEVKELSTLDILCMALGRAFCEELRDDQKFNAMLRLCNKITKLEEELKSQSDLQM